MTEEIGRYIYHFLLSPWGEEKGEGEHTLTTLTPALFPLYGRDLTTRLRERGGYRYDASAIGRIVQHELPLHTPLPLAPRERRDLRQERERIQS